jgi:hypothetical protein
MKPMPGIFVLSKGSAAADVVVRAKGAELGLRRR